MTGSQKVSGSTPAGGSDTMDSPVSVGEMRESSPGRVDIIPALPLHSSQILPLVFREVFEKPAGVGRNGSFFTRRNFSTALILHLFAFWIFLPGLSFTPLILLAAILAYLFSKILKWLYLNVLLKDLVQIQQYYLNQPRSCLWVAATNASGSSGDWNDLVIGCIAVCQSRRDPSAAQLKRMAEFRGLGIGTRLI